MTADLITTWDGLAGLESAWNALADGMPMRSWDWLATWWKHYGNATCRAADHNPRQTEERTLHVLAVYRPANVEGEGHAGERQLIGIAPWYLDRTVVKGQVLRWLGSGEVCTDHRSLICDPQYRDEVVAAVAEALTIQCDDWDQLDLSAVDVDDRAIGRLTAELEDRGCIVSRHPADTCWSLDLPAAWDDYLATLSKSHRKQLRRLEREVLESKRVHWHSVTSQDELNHAWSMLVNLHQRRRRSLGEPGCFASRSFHDFHREVAGRMLAAGQLRLSWLELDGSPVAAEYHFAGNDTTFAYQGGVDPDRLGEEPGRLSTICCLRGAMAEGQRRFDFMRGDEPYKAHWRAVPQATFDYRVVPNRRLARLRGRVLLWSDTVVDWIRQAAPHAGA
jgi:CelD/BcsL family acetyltransferase involved in cellulose biosynthesis